MQSIQFYHLIQAVLALNFDSIRAAKAVDSALSPDNINLPRGLKISQTRRGKELRISVEVKDPGMLMTLISTLDELVAHSDTAIKVLE